jgi:uncharacterized repeat protein (TIGR03803 family)
VKIVIKNPFHLVAMLAAAVAALPGDAQTFRTLYSFTAASGYNSANYPINSDGANPQAGLVVSGNILCGTTIYGGSAGNGTVFAIHPDGSGFTNLYMFNAGSGTAPLWINNDGAQPYAGLICANNFLYGTAVYGGTWGVGTVFALRTDGTGFTTLYNFSNGSDGGQPYGAVILSSNTLYGADADNAVFELRTDGTGFGTLYPLTTAYNPLTGFVLSSNTLYGTTLNGGGSRSDFGTVFAVNTDGTGFRIVHSFAGGKGGAHPHGSLALSGAILYGTTYNGGNSDDGTVFKVNIDGTGFAVLHSFSTINYTTSGASNNDGAFPVAGLALQGTTLYGAASAGGSSGQGTIFALTIDGTGFTNLHSFSATSAGLATNSDGAYPAGDLILSGNTLYGTAANGGPSGNGTIFSISLGPSAPMLAISPTGANVLLTWSTNTVGFTLQSTTNLASPAWTPVSPAPAIVNGQNTVTNPITATQRFYRLSH